MSIDPLTSVEQGFGSGHPDVAAQLNNRGEILSALHRYRTKHEHRSNGREHQGTRTRKSEILEYCVPLTGIGIDLSGRRNPPNALVPLDRALRIREPGVGRGKRAETGFALARALWESSRDRRSRAAGRTGQGGLLVARRQERNPA